MFKNFITMGVTLVALSLPATAKEDEASEAKQFPSLHIEIPIAIQFDSAFDANDPFAEFNDLYLTIEPEIELSVNEWLTLDMGLVFEPVLDPTPGEDRTFDDHGLYVSTAQAIGSFGHFTVNVGKFSAPFGIAYDYAPGVYGDTLNADIEIAERIGAGAAYNFSADGVDQGVILRAAAFYRDTSFLSGSLGANREPLDQADGGIGNTDGLENFSVSLDLLNLESLPDFHIHAAYLHQAAGDGDVTDQNAYVLGVNWQREITDGVIYQLLAEVARADDTLGFGDAVSIPGASQTDFTIAASGTWFDTWTAAIGYSHRNADDPLKDDTQTGAFNLSVGYFVAGDVLAEIAYLNIQEDGNNSQTVGLKLSHSLTFAAQ